MIQVVGIGPGSQELLTFKARAVIEAADILFGSQRQLDSIGFYNQVSESYEDIKTLVERLESCKSQKVVVLASGDPLVYGIGSTLRRHFPEVEIISGISSLHYMFSKIDQDMNDVYFTSAHGREPTFDLWFRMPKLAAVTDGIFTPAVIAKTYCDAGIQVKIYVGSALGYPEEQIICGAAEAIQNMSFKGLSVVVILHER